MAGISLTEEQIRQTGEVFTRESARLREQEGIVANRQVDATAMGQVLFGEAEAYQRDTENDTRLIGNGKQVLGQAANTAATSDEPLNAARPALVFFEWQGGRYGSRPRHQVPVGCPGSEPEIRHGQRAYRQPGQRYGDQRPAGAQALRRLLGGVPGAAPEEEDEDFSQREWTS